MTFLILPEHDVVAVVASWELAEKLAALLEDDDAAEAVFQ